MIKLFFKYFFLYICLVAVAVIVIVGLVLLFNFLAKLCGIVLSVFGLLGIMCFALLCIASYGTAKQEYAKRHSQPQNLPRWPVEAED